MRGHNVATVLESIMAVLQVECQKEADKMEILDFSSKFIIDDIILFEILIAVQIDYFQVVLDIYKHFCATLKLWKCTF